MNSGLEMDNEKGEQIVVEAHHSPPTRRNRPFAIAILSVALCYLVYTSLRSDPILSRIGCHRKEQVDSWEAPEVLSSAKELVPLEAHIMSKCPDARDCLQMLVLPTMQRVLNKVNFTLSYIGTYVYSILLIPESSAKSIFV